MRPWQNSIWWRPQVIKNQRIANWFLLNGQNIVDSDGRAGKVEEGGDYNDREYGQDYQGLNGLNGMAEHVSAMKDVISAAKHVINTQNGSEATPVTPPSNQLNSPVSLEIIKKIFVLSILIQNILP